MKGIVDRVENGVAAVETDDGMRELPAPEGLCGGDVVEIDGGVIIAIDHAAGQARRARMQARLDRMLKKKKTEN